MLMPRSMVTLNTSFRRPRSRRFPFDSLGMAALVWTGAFMVVAFVLGDLLH
jgi:hypothetical protein